MESDASSIIDENSIDNIVQSHLKNSFCPECGEESSENSAIFCSRCVGNKGHPLLKKVYCQTCGMLCCTRHFQRHYKQFHTTTSPTKRRRGQTSRQKNSTTINTKIIKSGKQQSAIKAVNERVIIIAEPSLFAQYIGHVPAPDSSNRYDEHTAPKSTTQTTFTSKEVADAADILFYIYKQHKPATPVM